MKTLAAAVAAVLIGAAATPAAAQDDLAARVAVLEKALAAQSRQIQVQKDIEDIRRLQFAYNYYNSGGFSKQLLDLVSENADSIEIGGQGVYKGKAGFRKLFGQYNRGKIEDRVGTFGNVLFQVAGMDVITVEPDGRNAKGRVRVLTPIFRGWPNAKPRFNGGDYEMEYVKENGRWLISKFKYVHAFSVTFEPDGKVSAGYATSPTAAADGPTTWYHPWPETGQLPFHFPNPITGQFPPDVTGKQQYWIGNWPGEFGKTGHK